MSSVASLVGVILGILKELLFSFGRDFKSGRGTGRIIEIIITLLSSVSAGFTVLRVYVGAPDFFF